MRRRINAIVRQYVQREKARQRQERDNRCFHQPSLTHGGALAANAQSDRVRQRVEPLRELANPSTPDLTPPLRV
jgi:hypothetical protein